MFMILLNLMGLDLSESFSIYSVQGLIIAYTYFQVPLGIMLLYPIYRGVREDWKEAASILGASTSQFWLRIGVPTILPSVLSTFTLLFANAMPFDDWRNAGPVDSWGCSGFPDSIEATARLAQSMLTVIPSDFRLPTHEAHLPRSRA